MTIDQAKQTIQSSTLPADIKAQALENLEKYPNQEGNYSEHPISNAIWHIKSWETDEGSAYWIGISNRAERGEFDQPAESESVEEIGGIEFFRRLKSIPNFTAKNIRLKLNDGWVTIGEIRVTTDNSPSQPD